MTLTDLLKNLANNELSNLGLVNFETNFIQDNFIPKVVNSINVALSEIYNEFFLKEETIIIELQESKVEYILTSEHNIQPNQPSDYDHYIYKPYNDTFKDDIIKITEVALNTGKALPLNNKDISYSVLTPSYNVLQVPLDIDELELAIKYKANHIMFDYDRDPNQRLELPLIYLPLLTNHVAYQIHATMNSQLNIANSQNYLSKYMLAKKTLINSGISLVDDCIDNDKFIKNGWC